MLLRSTGELPVIGQSCAGDTQFSTARIALMHEKMTKAGEILREAEKPLTEHVGYESDKFRSPQLRGHRAMPIPLDYERRFPLWVDASTAMGSAADPFTTAEIQELGIAERLLLEMETRVIRTIELQRTTGELGDVWLLTDLLTLSRLWLFGLYESLRTYR